MTIERIGMGNLLAELRDLKSQAAGALAVPGDVERPQNFAETLARSVEHVNAMQQDARHLATAFEMGDPGVDLVSVMVASQKAGLAFQAVSEVRNHLIRAYKDVMNMAI